LGEATSAPDRLTVRDFVVGCSGLVVGGIYVGVEAFAGMEDTQRALVSAFEDIYRSNRDWAVQLAWLLSHDESVAEDVAQDAFIALFQVFEDVEAPAAYLRRCVVNGVNQRARSGKRERRRNELVITGQLQVADGPTGGVADLIATLPLDQRTAVVLRYWGGLRDREIAEAMGIRASTARSLLSRASARLRKELL